MIIFIFHLTTFILLLMGVAKTGPPPAKVEATPTDISITLYPSVALNGNSRWLTCRVTPNEANRKLVYGIDDSELENSERQLDGYQAPITWGPYEVKHVGCDAHTAYCRVVRNDGSVRFATLHVEVGGCEPGQLMRKK
jgi:hypothetical protein